MSAALLIDDRQAWLEARRNGITATDVAAVLGVHPWRSMREVYLDKMGMLPDQEPNEAMKTGTDLEPYIAAVWCKRNGKTFGTDVVKADLMHHAKNEWAIATPDFLVGDDTVLETKYCGMNAAQHFGDEGSDFVPDHYLCQVMWQCYVTGRSKWILYVLGPWGFREFRGVADQSLIRTMEFQAKKFLVEYIQAETPPPLSGSAGDKKLLDRQYPTDNGDFIQADDKTSYIIGELDRLRAVIAPLETELAAAENAIKDYMGECTTLLSDVGKFTWKTQSRRTFDVKSAIEAGLLTQEQAEAHMKESSFRVFRTPFKGQKA